MDALWTWRMQCGCSVGAVWMWYGQTDLAFNNGVLRRHCVTDKGVQAAGIRRRLRQEGNLFQLRPPLLLFLMPSAKARQIL